MLLDEELDLTIIAIMGMQNRMDFVYTIYVLNGSIIYI